MKYEGKARRFYVKSIMPPASAHIVPSLVEEGIEALSLHDGTTSGAVINHYEIAMVNWDTQVRLSTPMELPKHNSSVSFCIQTPFLRRSHRLAHISIRWK